MVPSAAEVLGRLASDRLDARGFLANASNHTLLCTVGEAGSGVAAIYKPRAGERPLWDFPTGTLCQREVAAYEVSAYLGWDLVPPTVLRDGPMGEGSVQWFVPHDPAEHYFVLVGDPANHAPLRRMAVFDLLINNADRKGGHVLRAEDDGRLFGVDHGLAFHPLPKLRTVIWELGGTKVDGQLRADAGRLADALFAGEPVADRLASLLDADEIVALEQRAAQVARLTTLPDPPEEARPYPWPPL